jgi:YD repeat-containing protein
MTPPAGGGAAVSYGWDQARRIISAGPSGAVSSYGYDGDGLRTSKTVAGATAAFAWDVSGGLPLAVVDASGSVVYGAGGLPVEQVAADGTAQWLFHDQLGSTRALTDSSGAVVGSWTYEPDSAVVASSGSVGTHIGFAGSTRCGDGLRVPAGALLRPSDGPVHEPRPAGGTNPVGVRVRGRQPAQRDRPQRAVQRGRHAQPVRQEQLSEDMGVRAPEGPEWRLPLRRGRPP